MNVHVPVWVNVLETGGLRGMSLGLYPLHNVDPATLENELRRVLSATTGQADSYPPSASQFG